MGMYPASCEHPSRYPYLDQQLIKLSKSETPEAGDHWAAPMTCFLISSARSISTRPLSMSPES